MARMARVIANGIPHHITQPDNRLMETFFRDEDYAEYVSLMAEWCGRCGAGGRYHLAGAVGEKLALRLSAHGISVSGRPVHGGADHDLSEAALSGYHPRRFAHRVRQAAAGAPGGAL